MLKKSIYLSILISFILPKILHGNMSELHVTPPGKVIFVTGSCSSGKSSMAKILAQKLNAKTFAFDEYVMPIILKKFVQKHYGKFLAYFINKFFMKNFFTTIDILSEKKKYEMQLKFYNDLRSGLAIEPTKKMFSDVKKSALEGHNVIVEAPLYLWTGVDLLSCLSALDGTDITYVLAYCPWDCLIDRVKKRNASPDKKIHRKLDWVVINFIHTFEISQDYHGDHYLEYLSGKNVHQTIARYSNSHYKKKHLQLLKETQRDALQAFPTDNFYYIYPRFTYDITVNTKTHNPEQSAAEVLDYLKD